VLVIGQTVACGGAARHSDITSKISVGFFYLCFEGYLLPAASFRFRQHTHATILRRASGRASDCTTNIITAARDEVQMKITLHAKWASQCTKKNGIA
jgi:hypothetical protein